MGRNSNICVYRGANTNELVVENDKIYNFDHVFDEDSNQSEIFDNFVRPLIISAFKGENATGIKYFDYYSFSLWSNRIRKDIYNWNSSI